MSKLAFWLLMITAVLYILVTTGVGQGFWDNHEVCEFHQFACVTRAWQYECGGPDEARSLRLLQNTSEYEGVRRAGASNHPRASRPPGPTCSSRVGAPTSAQDEDVPQLEWGARVPLLTSRTCDRHMLRTSWWFFLPLVFLFVSAVVMPIVLFRNNLHRTTLIKVVVWTPVVPLILMQANPRRAAPPRPSPPPRLDPPAAPRRLVGRLRKVQAVLHRRHAHDARLGDAKRSHG